MFKQKKKKKMVLFILTHFNTKIKFPDWLGKALFWHLLANNPPTVKGGKAGCGSFNCGPRSKSFMDQTHNQAQNNKDSRTACLCRSMSYM